MNRNYFTLKEFCIVVVASSIVLTLILSAYSEQLTMGKKTVCTANLHKVYSAMQGYADDNDGFSYSYLSNGSLWCSASTYIRLVPYINNKLSTADLLRMNSEKRDSYCPKELICPEIVPVKGNLVSQYAYALPYSYKDKTPYKLFGNAEWRSPNGLYKYAPANLIVAGDSQVCNSNYTVKNFRAVNLSPEKSDIGCSVLKLRHEDTCNTAMLDGSVQSFDEDGLFDEKALPVMNSRGILVANRLDAIMDGENNIIKY